MIEDAPSRSRQGLNPISNQNWAIGLTKLFAHGILLSLLTYILIAGWGVFVGSSLISSGYSFLYFVGILLSFLVLIIGGGWSNLKVANWIWEFRTGRALTDYLVQGLLLAIPLLLVTGLISYLYIWNLHYGSGISTMFAIFTIVFFTILIGFIGRSVAFWFKLPPPVFDQPPAVQGSGITTVIKKDGQRVVFNGTRSTCPLCRESNRYYNDDRSREGMVACRKCGHYFYVEPIESLLEKLGEDVETRYTTEL
ncbi:MAG: hypothetical protein ACFFFO_13035 [Candidatus Thorarchaeota archaeon]